LWWLQIRSHGVFVALNRAGRHGTFGLALPR
jgi:hypothetical protein